MSNSGPSNPCSQTAIESIRARGEMVGRLGRPSHPHPVVIAKHQDREGYANCKRRLLLIGDLDAVDRAVEGWADVDASELASVVFYGEVVSHEVAVNRDSLTVESNTVLVPVVHYVFFVHCGELSNVEKLCAGAHVGVRFVI